MVAGVILNGLNSGLQRLDCDLPCLCNLYGFCFGFSQSDIVQFHILVNSVQVSGFKFFKSFRVLLTDQNPPAYEKSPPYISMVRPPDNHDEAAQVLDRGIVPASAFCENWQRMFLSSNAQTAPCCNHESVQSGSADRSVMGSGTNVQLLVVQKRILVIDSSGFPDLACLI